MRFFTGINPAGAKHLDAAFISVRTLRKRKSNFQVGDWIMDSSAFTEISLRGSYEEEPGVYAGHIRRWAENGNLLAAVSQDFMCEAFILEKTGLTIRDHQRLTIERYDALMAHDLARVYLMPVLQGYAPADYQEHVEQYGNRLKPDAWVGVGSVCKRNKDVAAVEDVLVAITQIRPDLRLHAFGIKTTALRSGLVRDLLHSADSMAWSMRARWAGRNQHDVQEAIRFAERIRRLPVQGRFRFE